MSIRSLLKSPSVIGGTSLAGAGGAGVGGWQIYEEVNPTTDRQLSRQGYSYSPIEAPDEDKPKDQKFGGSGWGCIKRLFPDSEVKYDDVSSSAASSTDPTSQDFSSSTSSSDLGKFTTCAIMEMRPVTLSEENLKSTVVSQNRIYLKSEVAVKGKDYGGIMGTGLSTFPRKVNNTYENNAELVYRLLELKKSGDKWIVNSGLGGDHILAQNPAGQRFIVFPPLEQDKGFKTSSRLFEDQSYFEKRTGAGIGEVDDSAESQEKDILGSISIYPNKNDESELWGSDGEFSMPGAGYTYSQIVYVNGQGWQRTNSGNNLSSSLKKWYAPFKGKKIKGTNLAEKCYEGSAVRNKSIISEEEDLRNLCYWKK